MILSRAQRSFRQLSADAALLRIGIGASLALNGAFGWALIAQPATVVLLPPHVAETLEFIDGKANAEYYKSWAWSIAMMMGNIDPGNIEFIRKELQRIADTGLYRDLQDRLQAELEDIRRDRAVITFSPREVVHDPALDLFFVTGRQTLGGPAGKVIASRQITYEMAFTQRRLRIWLTRLAVYDGDPMTADVRADRLETLERAERAAEAGRRGEDGL